MSDTYAQVVKILSENYDVVGTISKDSHILNDLGLDSIDLYDLVFAIEEKFDVSIPVDRWASEAEGADLSAEPAFNVGAFCQRIDEMVANRPG